MSKFNYKYDSIKKIKETFEKITQKEVSALEKRIEELYLEKEKLTFRELQGKSDGEKKKTTARDLQFRQGFSDYIQEMKDNLQERIEDLTREKEKKMKELIEKSKEVKIFKTLEEKHREYYTAEQNKIEMADLDEIALRKFSKE